MTANDPKEKDSQHIHGPDCGHEHDTHSNDAHDHQHHGHVHGPGCNHGAQTPFVRASTKVGRNDPCSCGSGLKFKKCCGKS